MTEVEQVEQVADGRHVARHIDVVLVLHGIGQVVMGVAVLIASTGVLGSAACTGAVKAKADSIAADAPAAILVRGVNLL